MTKAAALQAFFSNFGIPAYPAEDVPQDTVFPWLTYELAIGAWGDEAGITVNIWYYDESNIAINDKAQEISAAVGLGGKIIPCDGGAIWLKRGSPWCQSLRDERDDKIKRRYINVTADFFAKD